MVTSKTSLIIGGSGALGRAMVSSFRSGGWSVCNVEFSANDEANQNILINKDEPLRTQVGGILDQAAKYSSNYDSILCVAGGFSLSSIKDENIFETYEMEDKRNF